MNPATELKKFGISDAVTRSFAEHSAPELVNYLDLIPGEIGDGTPLPLDGAVEHDQRAVLYYVSEDRLSISPTDRETELARLNRSIASRGERAYLAIVKPGRLEVTPVRLGEVSPAWQRFDADHHEAINFYSNLVHGKIAGQDADDPDLVFDEMYKLLLTGADAIAHRIGRDNVLSLVGRALFFRFLCDRGVISENDRPKICSTAVDLRGCFDNSENAYRTSRWLDETFNGHFLPFREPGTRRFFEDLNRSAMVFPNLKAIVRGLEPLGNSQFQQRFDWAAFDFAHVPVGLLSQVYEAFSWKWDRSNSEETSVHYTPRNIAVTLVEEAFAALSNPHEARVLDPACGAGVFLVLAFRRLYMEHWKASGIRPDTEVIRKILETQLCGFDISESALRLAALSLYLTAIELDPNPSPPEKLKFRVLDDLVLFNHRLASDPETGPVLGSIRSDIGNQFDAQFDLVLCNPPWSSIDSEEIIDGLDSASKEIVTRRNEVLGRAYQNPRGEPDLPFLWKATQWCRPNGQIAMVLPARILFRQGDVATQTRTSLFRLIRFTGIVNCSNVRKTNVWPDMDQPFMLAFGRNEIPEVDSTFWFVSPQADYSVNWLGDLRVDAYSAHIVTTAETIEEPWLLKTLAIGTCLDTEVIRRLSASSTTSLDNYWEGELGLTSRQGYTVGGTPQHDASLLQTLLDVGDARDTTTKFSIDPAKYQNFHRKTLYRTLLIKHHSDPLRVYRAPILLLRLRLPRQMEHGAALISSYDICFNKSFYGYSAHGHPDATTLVQYLLLFAHSRIWTYFALCTSSKLGVERTHFYKEDFDLCPIVRLDSLPSEALERIQYLASRLTAEDLTVFEDIDKLFGDVYGLTQRELQVIDDTLTVRNPHDELGIRGSTSPATTEVKAFCSELRTAMRPFAKRVGREIRVAEIGDRSEGDAFRFIAVFVTDGAAVSMADVQKLILSLADRTGASLIIQAEKNGLLVGILNQYRYWTKSRARLLAAEILRDHFANFEDWEGP